MPGVGAETSIPKISKSTRSGRKLFGLEKSILMADREITGAKLPTYSQIIHCYLSLQQYQPGQTKHKTAKDVFGKIISFYNKGNVPLILEDKACQKIIEAIQSSAKLRTIPSHRRTKKFAIQKLEKETKFLEKTFPLWPKNAKNQITNEDDIKFLQSMKTDRIAIFGSFDRIHKRTIAMTPAQQRIYTKAVVEKSGGDSLKLNISYSYSMWTSLDAKLFKILLPQQK